METTPFGFLPFSSKYSASRCHVEKQTCRDYDRRRTPTKLIYFLEEEGCLNDLERQSRYHVLAHLEKRGSIRLINWVNDDIIIMDDNWYIGDIGDNN